MSDPQPATVPTTVPIGTLERVLGSTEPIRRALYPVIVAVVALLVGYGLVGPELAPLWIGLAVAVLGPAATEAARAVAFAPATVDDQSAAWSLALDNEYARGVAAGLERTPDRVAHEVLDDEPGEHSTDRLRTAAPRPALTRSERCREVEGGARCVLTREHAGPHMMTTG